MKFRKNHAKRVVGDTAMRAKPWDNTSKHAANTEALGRAVGDTSKFSLNKSSVTEKAPAKRGGELIGHSNMSISIPGAIAYNDQFHPNWRQDPNWKHLVDAENLGLGEKD